MTLHRRLLLLGLLLCGPVWAAEPGSTGVPSEPSLSFTEFYQKVLARYPQLKKQKARLEEALAERFQAYAALAPRATGFSSVTQGDDPVYVFGSLLRQERFASDNFELGRLNTPGPWTNFNFTLHSEVPVFNAFQTLSQIRASRYQVHARRQETEWVEMEAGLLALESFLKGLMLREALEWVRTTEEAALKDLEQAEDLKNQGVVLGADFYASKMRLAQVQQIHHEITADRGFAQVTMNLLMGEDPFRSGPLEGGIPVSKREATAPESWARTALENRPDFRAVRETVSAQKALVMKERASILPRIKAFADLTEDTHTLTEGGENYLMGFQGQMDFVDPSYLGRIRAAQAKLTQLLEEEKGLRDEVVRQVSQASLQEERVRRDVRVAAASLEDGKQAVDLTATLYREGRKSIADLLEMRLALLQTALTHERLRFLDQTAYANLLFLSGTLSEDRLLEFARAMEAA